MRIFEPSMASSISSHGIRAQYRHLSFIPPPNYFIRSSFFVQLGSSLTFRQRMVTMKIHAQQSRAADKDVGLYHPCKSTAGKKSRRNLQSQMAGIVVVFDFDKTIIDLDSDNWVVDELGAIDLFNNLLPTMPWNSLMDRMMMELHERGRTIDDITEVLKRAPVLPNVVIAIKAAHALGCDLRIVSDANLFFIETILNHLGIRECFSEIHTNPSYIDGEGRLRIFPIHDFHKSPHNFCPPNMCKGVVMERIQASLMAGEKNKKKKRFIYLGDGSGDYCPSSKLEEGDFVMPRKNFPLWDLISQNPLTIKAEIHEWSDGEELSRILLSLIDTISMEEEDKAEQFLLPQPVHEALAMAAN